MFKVTCRLMPALAAMSCGVLAMAADPTTESLKAQVDALQKKVDAMEAKQVSAADVNATVQKVLDDADRRSQMFQSEGFTGGWNNGKFTIQSADGSFSFSPIVRMQLRYMANYRDDQKADGNGSWEDGFEVRRAKIGASGNIFSKDLTYQVIWATNRGNDQTYGGSSTSYPNSNPASGELYLEEAVMRYKINKELSVFAGQWEEFVNRDEIISSGKMLAVDESMATQLLMENTLDYTQGIGATYLPFETLRFTAAYTDGAKTADSNFQDTNGKIYGTSTLEQFGAIGRVDWAIIGKDWKQYDQFSAVGAKDDLLVLGAGLDYEQSSNVEATFDSVDLLWQSPTGWSAYGAAISTQINPNDSSTQSNSFNWGFIGQVGYLFNKNWELFGRYDLAQFDNSALGLGGDNQMQEITAGVNYYIYGQTAKLTFDVVYLPQGFPKKINDLCGGLSGLGILPTNGDAQEVVARLQFSLYL